MKTVRRSRTGKVIALVAKGSTVVEACKRVGVSTTAYYNRLRRDAAKVPGATEKDRKPVGVFGAQALTRQDREAILFNLRNPTNGMPPLPEIVERYEATLQQMIDVSNRAVELVRQVNALRSERRDLLSIVAELTLDNYQHKHGHSDFFGSQIPATTAPGGQASPSHPSLEKFSV